MTSATVERSVSPLVGSQRPRICLVPEYSTSTGDEAIELAAMAGLILDDWQQFILRHSLGERPDGKWAAREVGLMVSRQNGKGALLEARELAGLFLLEEELIVHSAQQFDTASSHFRRLTRRIENTPELSRRIAKTGGILRGHGNESITLARNKRTGRQPRLEIRTRTGIGGLGFSISCLIFDEAMIISDEMYQALLPALSAQPNMQVWYTGSAVDQQNPSHLGVPFARIREKGVAGGPGLAYFEWSLDFDDPAAVGEITDQDLANVNPGLGIRIDLDYIRETEQSSLSPRGNAVQRYGVGDWPRTDGLENVPITPEAWAACTDANSTLNDPVVFAFDVPPDRSRASIAAAGWRSKGHAHVEVVEKQRGTGWLAARLKELVEKHKPAAVLCDASGPVATLLPEVEKLGVQVTPLNSREHAQACGLIFDMVQQQTLSHFDDPDLAAAIQGSEKKPLEDAWKWSRKNSAGEISPLVAVTLALWGIQTVSFGEAKVIDMREIEAEMRERGEL